MKLYLCRFDSFDCTIVKTSNAWKYVYVKIREKWFFKRVVHVSYYGVKLVYSQLSLNEHLFKRDTVRSVKWTPRVGPSPSLLPLFDSLTLSCGMYASKMDFWGFLCVISWKFSHIFFCLRIELVYLLYDFWHIFACI